MQFPEESRPFPRKRALALIAGVEYARAMGRMIDVVQRVQPNAWTGERVGRAIKFIEIAAQNVHDVAYVHIDQHIHVVDAEKLQVPPKARRRKYPVPSMQDARAPGQLTDLLKSVEEQ